MPTRARCLIPYTRALRGSRLAGLLLLAGCASIGTGDGEPSADQAPAAGRDGDGVLLPELGATMSGLRSEIEAGIESERARVDAFPDLPDAGGGEGDAAPADSEVATAVGDALPGAASRRAADERRAAFDGYAITAHRQNFLLPLSLTSNINEGVYLADDRALRDEQQPVEVKFQISLKSRLNRKDLWLKDDELSVALTLEAWWQLYAKDLSSPFRETNYSPEIFYVKPLLWGPFSGSTAWFAGFVHESNGQVQGLSRSWNRLYAGLIYERGDFVMRLRPWYRLPEKDKPSADSPAGDDNPEIVDFMGHGDLEFYWRDERREYGLLTRYNPSTDKGAVTARVTFPAFGGFRALIEYFNGYGESLIDYDHHQQRLSLGFALTNLY